LRAVTALRDRLAGLQAIEAAVRRQLQRGGDEFSLFAHLEAIGREVLGRERIAAMNPSTRTVSDELQEDDVEMRLSGVPLPDLTRLLYRIEKGSLPLLVSRLQMKKRFDESSLFDVVLVVGRLRATTPGSA
jgi:hypothetical protein